MVAVYFGNRRQVSQPGSQSARRAGTLRGCRL